ncbi:vitamin K epoxide reductase family protein [Corynebacterium sp. J010B-136]|uniref:vitamin K epoxide reductase family protein n=1 Tax=Corynebacterium sp. J010B-136 TaxID=2099401 RepID=UPI000CF89211|nr:vitamin K epoxide reductase family protein [Corynebacterium sp. J010B-136]PQM73651.1 vitamin K epoxide reductase [Corynebacterium sp. J010B-136]
MTDLQTRSDTAAPATPTAPVAGRRLGVLLLVGGVIGLIAATVLLIEKIALLGNPDYIPTCNINPILSCGSVMTTPQAEAFGVPNPVIGIAGFAAVAVIGAAILAGGRFHPWFRVATQAGVTFAVVFVHWLIYQSLYVIGALCPYCMVVWAVTIPLFWYTTLANLQPFRQAGPQWARRIIDTLTSYHGVVLTVWVLGIIILIAHRFWDYWTTLV